MYGRAFGWEWFAETLAYCELFPGVECYKDGCIVSWLYLVVYVNRICDGQPFDSSGNSD